jgi:aminopeptidase YwaD
MKSTKTFIITCLLFISILSFAQQNPEITAKELKKDVFYLASDSLKGRKPGTPEGDLAANFIREQFRAAGLKLLADNGFQYFEIVTDVALGENNHLKFKDFNGTVKQDFIPLVFSSNGEVNAPVVFAGYGFDIDQDSLKWKDYNGIYVKGKWVMIFRGDPELDNPDSKFIPYGDIRGKVLTAKDHGAAGVFLVTPKSIDKDDKLMVLRTENNEVTSGIPVINIRHTIGDQLLQASGLTLDSLERMLNRTRKPMSFSIPVQVSCTSDVIQKKARTENVIGMIEGTDPVLKDEYIVIGGHYDHLGFGGQGSGSRMPDTVAIHNGADDNASGTALVMEMAGKLASVRSQLKRSIIFISFTGEEMGLLGSKYFVDHPDVELKKIKAMFNFDMVGRYDKDKKAISVSGTGTSLEGDSILRMFEKQLPFAVTHSPEGFGPSDHASFYASNIPVFFYTTGTHMDYHTPFDDADKLDYDMEKTIGDYAFNTILYMDDMPHDLSFRESGKKESYTRGDGRRLKVTLGIMPDFAGTETKGLRVDGVTKGGPADHGGMKKGDIITSLNGMKVGNIYEYMSRLGKLKPGQTISVEVLREGKTEVLIVQL